MALIRVTFDGSTDSNGSPILMHNERLADPLDPYTRWLAELSGKRKKTERDHEEIGRREFLGSGYWDTDEGPDGKVADPVIPTWNIVRCLQESAKRHRLGQQMIRAVVPINDTTPLIYDGPRDASELWQDGRFHSRKGVGVGGKKVMRTRPTFTDWSLEVELELDLSILDPDVVNALSVEAGRYIGLGDARPRFGRFAGNAVLLSTPADFAVTDELSAARLVLARQTAVAAITGADQAHEVVHPNGGERKKRVRAKQ